MLRRTPTAISLSSRDVIEHLEHIDLQKIRERENVQPRQSQRVASMQGASVPTVSLGEYPHNNERNEVTAHEFAKANRQRVLRENATFAPTPPPGPAGGAEGSSPSDIDVDLLGVDFLGPEELPSLEQCSTSEVDDNLVPSDPVDSSGYLEEPPLLRHEDPSEPSSPKHAFDYGGFVESTADHSSSFGEFVANSCDIFTTLPTNSMHFVSRPGTNHFDSPTGHINSSQ
jgi:Anaphase-promoting complex APC subunit CDC26